jgi:hypothetical protein
VMPCFAVRHRAIPVGWTGGKGISVYPGATGADHCHPS